MRAYPEGVIAVRPAEVATLIRPRPGGFPTDRDLLLQALLHLPRIARPDGTIAVAAAIEEIERLRTRRAAELEPFRDLAMRPDRPPALAELDVQLIEPAQANRVLDSFHYLGSARADAVTVGALHRGRVVALCSVSPFDLPAIAARLPIAAHEVRVVSRVFAFDWAPRNVVSYLLARAERTVAAIPDEVRMLLTYLNPNMGFSGASYRAANWLPCGRETGTCYAYLDSRYVTDRKLAALPPRVRLRAERSRMRLEPLEVLCRLIDARLRRLYPGGFAFEVERRPAVPLTHAVPAPRAVTRAT